MSWGFIGLAVGALTAYFVVIGHEVRKAMKDISEETEEMDESEDETPE